MFVLEQCMCHWWCVERHGLTHHNVQANLTRADELRVARRQLWNENAPTYWSRQLPSTHRNAPTYQPR